MKAESGRSSTAVKNPRPEERPEAVHRLASSYACLVAAMYQAHNAGRIDIERDAGETATGQTTMREVLAPMIGGG